jgi:hypothetical protein
MNEDLQTKLILDSKQCSWGMLLWLNDQQTFIHNLNNQEVKISSRDLHFITRGYQ